MDNKSMTLMDREGNEIASMIIDEVTEDGWYCGHCEHSQFSKYIAQTLDDYDQIIEGQMLSFADEAIARINALGLLVRDSSGLMFPVYSLHVDKHLRANFRVSPTPQP